ncbi:MAG: hypothetical protein RL660_907 [Bacteroidota bacterium]|jgi:hypothetical protein
MLVVALCCFASCHQGDPPVVVVDNTIPQPKGDFEFSGFQFKYKNAISPVGPGPNRFSGTADFAWVDSTGRLHLKIAKKNNIWTCSEVVSTKVFGYGTYIVTCESDITTFSKNAVFGFFTWDDYSFQTQANSEVDIEFSRWGSNDTNLVTNSVQPVIFSNPTPYSERTYVPKIPTKYIKQPMTYMFKWTPDSIRWESYAGSSHIGTPRVSEWTFTRFNQARQKIEGSRVSNPIIIPAPSDSTNLRFNLWLLNGAAPSNNAEHEVIMSNLKYIPL